MGMSQWNTLIDAIRLGSSPAPTLRTALMAQCILESNRGTSRLAVDHNNYAGIKWRKEMEGLATKVSYGAHDGIDDYCAFVSPSAFVRGYWAFIGRSVYDGWLNHADDPAGYIAFLKSRGYAGDENYVAKVVGLFPEADRLLGNAGGSGELDRPSRNLIGNTVSDNLAADADPEFVAVPGVIHKWGGVRPNGLEGAIVHYDAGRTKPRGADDTEWGARNTLQGAVTNGFAYCTIS